jgi:cell cycle related kinase
VDQRNGSKVAIKKVKIRKMEDGLPKELIWEIESQELITEPKEDQPNYVVKIEEVYIGSTNVNIVYTPYCSKGDLQKHLAGNAAALTLQHIYGIMFQLLDGFEQIHEQSKLMHRDVKPQNILINHLDKTIVICDFG